MPTQVDVLVSWCGGLLVEGSRGRCRPAQASSGIRNSSGLLFGLGGRVRPSWS
jgi:hypothetical protein